VTFGAGILIGIALGVLGVVIAAFWRGDGEGWD
jgi:hypothetical protein